MPIMDIFGIGEAIQDFVRGLLWGMVEALMNLIVGLLDALTKGILSFSILNNSAVTEALQAMLVLALIIIIPKVTFEILTCLMKDDEIDIPKRLLHLIIAISAILSLQTIIPIINNTFTSSMNELTSGNELNISDEVITNTLVAFGGMPQNGDAGASEMITQWKNGNLNITERNSDGTYKWQFSEIITFIGLLIFVVLIFAITFQIAFRSFLLVFYYIFGPQFCLNLTNYKSLQIFNVWRNSVLSIFLVNFAQMALLVLLAQLLGTISSFTAGGLSGAPLIYCKISLYVGAFLMVFSTPSVISSALGGYTGSLLDTVRQIQGATALGKGMTIGTVAAVSGGLANTFGRTSSSTGHLSGGLRGALLGNKDGAGGRFGGIPGTVIGNKKGADGELTGGLRSAIVGDKSSSLSKDGSTQTTRSGGIRGAFVGNTTKAKSIDGSIQTTRSGGLRGAFVGTSKIASGLDGGKVISRQGGLQGMLRTSPIGTQTETADTSSAHISPASSTDTPSSSHITSSPVSPASSASPTSTTTRTGAPTVTRSGLRKASSSQNVKIDKDGGMTDSKPSSTSPVKRNINGKE